MLFKKQFQSLALFFLLNLAILTAGTTATAADLGRLSELFHRHFWGSFYEEGKCGPNSEYLVRLALKEEINLQGAYLLHVENKGGDTFGLVAALRAREQGRFLSSASASPQGPQREPGEANWYYHAFVLADGYVFDLDFENHPQVLALADYIYAMFVPEAKRSDPRFFQNKLGGYYLSLYPIKTLPAWNSFRAPRQELLGTPIETYLLPYLESLNGR